jgi:uncharacterized protein YcbX
MARKTEEERIAELEARKKALEAQLQAIQARKKARSRKDDTRRMILIGRAVWSQGEKDETARKKLLRLLDGYLDRDVDRALFDLPEKPKAKTESVSEEAS